MIIGPPRKTFPCKARVAAPFAWTPVPEVWKAKPALASKRGQGTGFSGIENPPNSKDNSRAFHGDPKASVDGLLQGVG